MSELFDKQTECIKREFEEKLPASSHRPTKKVCNDGKKELVHVHRSTILSGTIKVLFNCLVNKWMHGCKGDQWFFRRDTLNRCHKACRAWLILRIQVAPISSIVGLLILCQILSNIVSMAAYLECLQISVQCYM